MQQKGIQYEERHTADKSPFFAYGAENEVGLLLRDKVGLGEGAVEEPLANEAAGADGKFRLVDVVARTLGVVALAEEHVDALALVGFEDRVEDEVDREDK